MSDEATQPILTAEELGRELLKKYKEAQEEFSVPVLPDGQEEVVPLKVYDAAQRRELSATFIEACEAGNTQANEALTAFGSLMLATTSTISSKGRAERTEELREKLASEPLLQSLSDFIVQFYSWVEGSRKRPAKNRDVLPALRSDHYNVHTGQEWEAMKYFANDGKNGHHVASDDQSGAIRHQRPGAPYGVRVALLDEEITAGYGSDLLLQAAAQLDADDFLVWLCVSDLLAPPEPLSQRAYAGGWIDLDDVARKTLGGYGRNPQEIEERRRKVYHAVLMGARAEVVGKRSTKYIDKRTGEEIPTRIHCSLWAILQKEQPIQPALWPSETIPVRVELVASREWTRLTTRLDTAQYLPFGELIGAIPGNKAGGAWARALGVSYLEWCREHLHDALHGPAPTRRKLFDTHAPKLAPPAEILKGKDPGHVLKYWKTAEGLLCERGLIVVTEHQGKPAGYGWKDDWMNGRPPWAPGPKLRPVLEGLAQNKFVDNPRQLNPAKASKKRGRPRKAAQQTA